MVPESSKLMRDQRHARYAGSFSDGRSRFLRETAGHTRYQHNLTNTTCLFCWFKTWTTAKTLTAMTLDASDMVGTLIYTHVLFLRRKRKKIKGWPKYHPLGLSLLSSSTVTLDRRGPAISSSYRSRVAQSPFVD